MSISFGDTPSDLPVPIDDGLCNHLQGISLPSLSLACTSGETVDLAGLAEKKTVLFIYPATGTPGTALPEGWNDIPGARGCTPESLAFKEAYTEIEDAGYSIYGMSAQTAKEHVEAKERLALPYHLLSDEHFIFCDTVNLPTFKTMDGKKYMARCTLLLAHGTVDKVIYPVFPTSEAANMVLKEIRSA